MLLMVSRFKQTARILLTLERPVEMYYISIRHLTPVVKVKYILLPAPKFNCYCLVIDLLIIIITLFIKKIQSRCRQYSIKYNM